MARKPALQSLWNNFPDHTTFATMQDLFTHLGGQAERNINEPGFGPDGNTCAARLSMAFNQSGFPVKRGPGISTLSTKGKGQIIFRVSEFRLFLGQLLGKPVRDRTTPFNDKFMGKKGIIAFSINFKGATGHIALWNGSAFREPAYDSYEAYVNGGTRTSLGEFWELP
jgi:hypothetical protein